jgi:hypothetical protein
MCYVIFEKEKVLCLCEREREKKNMCVSVCACSVGDCLSALEQAIDMHRCSACKRKKKKKNGLNISYGGHYHGYLLQFFIHQKLMLGYYLS